MVKDKYTVKQVLAAIEGSCGIKAEIARRIGAHRHLIERYAAKHEIINAAIEQERERVIDKAESNLFTAIENGSIEESKWILARIAAYSRGYSDKVDMTTKSKENVTIKVIYEDAVPEDAKFPKDEDKH